MLTNNGYRTSDIDREIETALNDLMTNRESKKQHGHTLVLYYKNQMTSAHKLDERVIKDIVKKHVTPTDQYHLKLLIYYKNKKTANMIMRNNQHQESDLKCTNVVYEFICPHEDCKPPSPKSSYIGHTTNTLTRRLTFHKQNGEIQKHMKLQHGRDVRRSDLAENTHILAHESNRRLLRLLEAVFIQKRRPSINVQRDHAGIITLHDICA